MRPGAAPSPASLTTAASPMPSCRNGSCATNSAWAFSPSATLTRWRKSLLITNTTDTGLCGALGQTVQRLTHLGIPSPRCSSNPGSDEEAMPCYCGTPSCRGEIGTKRDGAAPHRLITPRRLSSSGAGGSASSERRRDPDPIPTSVCFFFSFLVVSRPTRLASPAFASICYN
jgi:hypothetical protein